MAKDAPELEAAREAILIAALAHVPFDGWSDKAIAAAQRAIDLSGGNPLYTSSLGHAHAKAGNHSEARAVLEQLEQESATKHVSAYHIAVIHAALGDIDRAFAWMESALEERSPWIGYLKVDPRVDPLRSDPRFGDLLRKLHLDS